MNAKIELKEILNKLENPKLISVESLMCPYYPITGGYCNKDEIDINYDSDRDGLITIEELLDKLDFEYNDGFGLQKLYGFIYLLDDNGPVWLTRGEYDGSEWWDVNTIPEIYKM